MEFEFQYKVVSNLAVKSGKMRLRTCQALPALNWAINKKIKPDEFFQLAKPLYSSLESRFDNSKEGLIIFKFKDMSDLVWIERLKLWTIRYPMKVDLVYIPSSIPEDVDKLADNNIGEYGLWAKIK